MPPGIHLPAHLVQFWSGGKLAGHRLARHRTGQQVPRPMAGVLGVRAGAVRLAATAVGGGEGAAPEVAGTGQIGVKSAPPCLELGEGGLVMVVPPSLDVANIQTTTKTRSVADTPTFLAHTPAYSRHELIDSE